MTERSLALLYEISHLKFRMPTRLGQANVTPFAKSLSLMNELFRFGLIQHESTSELAVTAEGRGLLARHAAPFPSTMRHQIDGLWFEVATPGWADGDASHIHAAVLQEILLVARNRPARFRALHGEVRSSRAGSGSPSAGSPSAGSSPLSSSLASTSSLSLSPFKTSLLARAVARVTANYGPGITTGRSGILLSSIAPA